MVWGPLVSGEKSGGEVHQSVSAWVASGVRKVTLRGGKRGAGLGGLFGPG